MKNVLYILDSSLHPGKIRLIGKNELLFSIISPQQNEDTPRKCNMLTDGDIYVEMRKPVRQHSQMGIRKSFKSVWSFQISNYSSWRVFAVQVNYVRVVFVAVEMLLFFFQMMTIIIIISFSHVATTRFGSFTKWSVKRLYYRN